jgi:hypothetical protein
MWYASFATLLDQFLVSPVLKYMGLNQGQFTNRCFFFLKKMLITIRNVSSTSKKTYCINFLNLIENKYIILKAPNAKRMSDV